MNKLSIVLFSLAFLAMMACNRSKVDPPTPPIDYISKDVPSDFLAFYERFHHDEKFQMEHIVFPLSGARQDTSTLDMVDMKWHMDSWTMHKEFNSHNGTYERSFTNLQGIIIEVIQDTGARFSMERRFSKSDGKWNLIFYSEFKLIKQ